MKHPVTTITALLAALAGAHAEQTLQNRHAAIRVDDRGFITSLKAAASNKEYSPKDHPSALLCLHENGKPNSELITPTSAVYDAAKHHFTLKYPNGATATVSAGSKGDYFRFQLIALEPRGTVDTVVWGPLNTSVSGKIGDIIGVVRDRDFAIGMYSLDDNTIPGAIEEGDCYEMGYYIHSTDPEKFPVPEKYKEGQWFNIGGDGIGDVAFYSHPEEYFNQVFGTGARVRPEFGSTVSYYSRDRRRSYVHHYSLLPGFKIHERKHMVSDPIPGVDFIGSGVAIYACPDDLGIETLRSIFRNENLPYITDRDGKWVRDPAAARPTVYWNGPVDKAIAYSKAMGFRDISRDTGEFYSTLPTTWVGHVNHGGKNITYKEFAEMCHREGITHGGLHTLCMFLQGGVSSSVTPVPSENLQTVCRTKLAKDLSPTDTEIVVTEPSFLAEMGTWPKNGDGQNYIRVGGEMMMYQSLSESAPWTLKGVKRGHASKAFAHKAGDELVKLQQNCYNGFVPDMKLMLAYADDYVDLMVRNGMDTINYDGYEVMAYTNHGYYAFNIFNRRLFEGYHAKTGKWPRVTGSNIFGGAWAFFNVCDLGGGDNMFNSFTGKRAIEGKDIGNAFQASWFPGTFGIQGWHANWSLYDAQNLMAKAVGWEATFALSADQKGIDATGEKDAIFTAFSAWQAARERQLFTKAQKESLRDPERKFHLVGNKDGSFTLYHIRETKLSGNASSQPQPIALPNNGVAQNLQFDLRFDAPVNGCAITLPGGAKIQCSSKIDKGQMIIYKGKEAFIADGNRNRIAGATLKGTATLPASGESKLAVQIAADGATQTHYNLTILRMEKSERLAP